MVPSVATRIRMVTYYLDPVDNGQGLRLMRRIVQSRKLNECTIVDTRRN